MQPDHIVESNKARHDFVADCTVAAIANLKARGERISFYSVAKEAQVARSTLYRRSDLRLLVESARDGSGNPEAKPVDLQSKVLELEMQLERASRERDALMEMSYARECRYALISYKDA